MSSSEASEPSVWQDSDGNGEGGPDSNLELDAIINKYDFRKATTTDEYALKESLDHNSRRLISKGNVENVKRAVAALQKKICLKGFPIRNTPACSMANSVVDLLSEITEKRISVEENQKLMFEFLLACIATGPSSSHASEIIQKVIDMKGMGNYIKKSRGEVLTRLFDTMKKVEFTPEQPTMALDDQATYWGDCMLHSLVSMAVDRDNKKRLGEPDVHAEMVDLHSSFLQMMGDLPKAFSPDIKRVLRGIQNGFDENGGNMLEVMKKDKKKKSLRSKEIVQRKFENLQNVVRSEKFGRNKEQLERTIEEIEGTLHAIRETPEILEFWDTVLEAMKELALSEKCARYPEIIKPYRLFFLNLEEKRFKKNPELVTKWIPVFDKMLQKSPSCKSLEGWAFSTTSKMAKFWVPQKESAVFWLSIVKGLVQYSHPDAGRAAYYILNNDKFKAIWDWKKQETHAIEIVNIIGKIDFPTEKKKEKRKKKKNSDSDSSDSDDSSDDDEDKLDDNIWENFAECIETLLKQFKLHKIDDKLGPTVTELIIKTMEKRSAFLNRFADHMTRQVSLKNYPSVVPDLIGRIVVLVMKRDYPWLPRKSVLAARSLMRQSLDSYSEGKKMPAVVNKTFIKVIMYTMETEDLPMLEGVRLDQSIYFEIVSNIMEDFICKHMESDSYKVCTVLIPGVIKQRNHELDDLRKTATSILKSISNNQPALLSTNLGTFIKWYSDQTDQETLDLIDKTYKVSRGLKKDEFRLLLQTLLGDKSSATKETQSDLILKMGVKQPEFFIQKDIDEIIVKYVSDEDTQYNALAAFSKIMVKNPDLFGENMITHVLRNRKVPLEYSVDFVGITLARQKKEMVKPIMKEFMTMAKRCFDSTDQVTVINGARSLAVMHGKSLLEPYKLYFEDLKKNGSDVMVRDMATLLLNAVNGVNVEAIKKQFKEKLEVLDDLVVQVAETKEDIAEVKTTVKKQGKEIQTVKTKVKTVKEDVKEVKKDLKETQIKVEEVDHKTMTNAPKWSRDLTKLMNPKTEHDWRLLAQRLGYTPQDIKGWATQHDPCMGLLSEWYATHKTIEATRAILNILQEMNRLDAAAIVENAMKAVEGVVEEEIDYATPPPIFLSYQWGHQNEVKLLRNHLIMAGYECWMDIGQMGGGDKLFEKIDNGIRGAKVILCCVSEKYAKSPNCNREVNMSVNLGKPMIPLLMEKMAWPPIGSMGPIFSEYLFVRFFQRRGEETEDQRYWPVPKFQELLMQLNMYKTMPDKSIISGEYKDWWVPVTEEIVITKKKNGGQSSQVQTARSQEDEAPPDIFLSYQWGKQKQVKQLYRRLNELGYSCWMDIYQMGGGDSLYDKIDRGIRGCKIVLSCVTTKYALSANCRREVSLADFLKKPMIPLLLEKIDWPPAGPMSLIFTQLLFINFYRDEVVQMTWVGDQFDELNMKIKESVSPFAVEEKNQEQERPEAAIVLPKSESKEPPNTGQQNTDTQTQKSQNKQPGNTGQQNTDTQTQKSQNKQPPNTVQQNTDKQTQKSQNKQPPNTGQQNTDTQTQKSQNKQPGNTVQQNTDTHTQKSQNKQPGNTVQQNTDTQIKHSLVSNKNPSQSEAQAPPPPTPKQSSVCVLL